MPSRLLKTAKFGLNVSALTVSLFGLAVALVWVVRPALVDRLDAWVIAEYKRHYEQRYHAAEQALKTDLSQGLTRMEQLAVDLEPIRKGDRLAQMKRVVCLQLVQGSLAAGQPDRALAWADRWLAFDARDFDAMLTRARTLFQVPGREEEALSYLQQLQTRYGDVDKVRVVTAQLLRSRGLQNQTGPN